MRRLALVPLVLISLLAVACTATGGLFPIPGALGGGPTVTISSPESGATFALGATIPVVATALDTAAVYRLDLAADGVVVDSYITPVPTGQPSVAAQLSWTATTSGTHSLSVTAYRPDGTAGAPATITIAVVEPGQESTPPASAPTTTEPSAEPTPTATPRPLVIDLTPASVNVTQTDNPDGSTGVDISLAIANHGTDPSGPFQVSVTCQGDVKTLNFRSVAGGSERSAHVTFGPSDDGTTTPQRVWVDPNRRIHEIDKSNNTFRITDPLCAPKPPDIDLRLSSINVLEVTDPDGTSYKDVEVLIKNDGTDASGPFVVEAVCQGTNKDQTVPRLAPGAYKSVDLGFLPTDTGLDTNPRVFVDVRLEVDETDENNNLALITNGQCDAP